MRGLMVLSDYCEDTEALSTRALLVRSGIHIDTVTINESKRITTAYGLEVKVDYHKDEIDLDDYQFLVIPGGKYVSMIIDKDTYIKSLSASFKLENKLIAAICAGPRFLGEMGLLKNTKYVIYPGLAEDTFEGFYQPHLKAVTDGLIITGRGAGCTVDFAYEIIKFIKGEAFAKSILKQIALD
ncbi:4-methyl-5(b-hydroxyethyl)-thiazole monophosphate biosynthesis [Acholeplasma morum]|uniref:DJ-1/PfpI family protein n=1 Tax=Paracholeplasma morum TaxID=264637 RepID=UPI0019578A49|nr:DJ-1/PfpI family protein [Paracholeplasma morum]MBM7453943.1 4-methyl-5(b-hydroxyethyl)-thiazole monophosphate biosynthesis [Paracholeplasma morum]